MSKHWFYFKYMVRHKYFVFIAGRKTYAPLWRLIIHDWSKFFPCEWFPYARYFYGEKPQTENKQEWRKINFDRAWLHHQHANPHHWQHWVLREDSGETKLLEMPLHFVREMVADWMGAGRAITGKWEIGAWYEKNREKIQIQDSTRGFVEALLYAHAGLKEAIHAAQRNE